VAVGRPVAAHASRAKLAAFSIFKRGMTGIYQHCDEKHLHRYLTEYQFRYNNRVKLGVSDIDWTIAAVRGIEGKRLVYRQPD
jgi:hypothetical protein